MAERRKGNQETEELVRICTLLVIGVQVMWAWWNMELSHCARAHCTSGDTAPLVPPRPNFRGTTEEANCEFGWGVEEDKRINGH